MSMRNRHGRILQSVLNVVRSELFVFCPQTLVKLITYTCSSLSSVFLIVVLSTCLNWLLMFKISVVIFVQPKFGYYIHGRSAQGHADVSMKEMHELLRREEDDLCGHRGLLPDTEQQTFQMTLPSHIYEQYCRMRRPLYTVGDIYFEDSACDFSDGHLSRVNIDTVVNIYNVVTKFLSAFLDH
ncbi:hypothetical protein V5799_010064, partial [Amblyomma americanum]